MENELYEKLKQLAFARTKAFCYSCYETAPSGTCLRCHSDDLMRLLPGVGCEYGTDWVIREILESELNAVDVRREFEESVRECYPKSVTVAWATFDTVTIAKELDPFSWQTAESEWVENEVSDGNILSVDGGLTYFWKSDLKTIID